MDSKKNPNSLQVSQVVKYVRELIENRGARVLARDIGVISPYRKQVQKIDKQLAVKYPGVKVGSVEQFQGRVSEPGVCLPPF